MPTLHARVVLLVLGVAVLTITTALTVTGGGPRDSSGVPLRSDARSETTREAAGGSVVGVCILEGEAWSAFPPTEAAILAAQARGGAAAVDDTYSLGPVDAVAKARGLEVRWSDGATVYAIDPTAKLPTVIGFSRTVIGQHELWSVTFQSTVGGCDGDQVPAAPAP